MYDRLPPVCKAKLREVGQAATTSGPAPEGKSSFGARGRDLARATSKDYKRSLINHLRVFDAEVIGVGALEDSITVGTATHVSAVSAAAAHARTVSAISKSDEQNVCTTLQTNASGQGSKHFEWWRANGFQEPYGCQVVAGPSEVGKAFYVGVPPSVSSSDVPHHIAYTSMRSGGGAAIAARGGAANDRLNSAILEDDLPVV